MSHQPTHIYEFGSFRLDVTERLLQCDGAGIPLQPKIFDLLLVLVEHHGHLLEKDDLMKLVWSDAIVEEANLANNISILRKTLGVNGEQFIETVPKHGYRFVAQVREVDEEQEALVTAEQAATTNDQPASMSNQPAAKRLVAKNWLAVTLGILLVVIGGLYTWRDSERPTIIHSLAVLPFKPLVNESRDEVWGMGLADTLIFKLSGLKQLVVRPVSAVRKYTSPEQDPLAVGREQKVDFVLDSSFQRDGERIRVRARLLNVANETTLWTYECDEQYCANLFTMQDNISAKVMDALALHLTGVDRARLSKHGTENREAYHLYLRGQYHVDKRSIAEAEKGIDYFQQALRLDPKYALAYAGMAHAYTAINNIGGVPPKEVMPKAKAAVMKALELDDQLAEAYAALGEIKLVYDWDWAGAEQALHRAVAMNPNSRIAHDLYSVFLMTMGRFDEALEQNQQALTIDPLSLVVNRNRGHIFYRAHQYDRAIEQFQKTLDLDPNFLSTYGFLANVYEAQGNYEQALTANLKTLSDDNTEDAAVLREAAAVGGWKGYWQKQLELAQVRVQRGRYVASRHFVYIYARLEEKERVFEWLEKAYQERNLGVIFLKAEPLLDSLRSDSRYTDLLRRLNLAP